MAVELDVTNRGQILAPGMYSTANWPGAVRNGLLFVPKTSIVTSTERTFIVRAKNGRAEWVNVQKGPADGDLIRGTGAIQAGDLVVKRTTVIVRSALKQSQAVRSYRRKTSPSEDDFQPEYTELCDRICGGT